MLAIVTPILTWAHNYRHDGREMTFYTAHRTQYSRLCSAEERRCAACSLAIGADTACYRSWLPGALVVVVVA